MPTVVRNSSTSVHPHGSGAAMPPGRDEHPGQLQQNLQAAASSLGACPPEGRAAALAALVAADDGTGGELAEWLARRVVAAAPEAAAAGGGAPVTAAAELGTVAGSFAAAALTAKEAERYERDGFLLVPGALGPHELAAVAAAAAQVDREWRERMGIGASWSSRTSTCATATLCARGDGDPWWVHGACNSGSRADGPAGCDRPCARVRQPLRPPGRAAEGGQQPQGTPGIVVTTGTPALLEWCLHWLLCSHAE